MHASHRSTILAATALAASLLMTTTSAQSPGDRPAGNPRARAGCRLRARASCSAGFVALEILNLLEGYDLKALAHNSEAYLHLVAEAKRIGFADRRAFLAVAGETGVALHNRGSGFVLDAGHPNQIAPHTRPLHTLVPAMILRDGQPWVAFGVMGGDMQAQGHAQVVMNLVAFGMNIQEAGEAARIRPMAGGLAIGY